MRTGPRKVWKALQQTWLDSTDIATALRALYALPLVRDYSTLQVSRADCMSVLVTKCICTHSMICKVALVVTCCE